MVPHNETILCIEPCMDPQRKDSGEHRSLYALNINCFLATTRQRRP